MPKWVQAEAPRLFMAGLMAADPALRRCVNVHSLLASTAVRTGK